MTSATQQMNIKAGTAQATVNATVTDGMPAIPCPDPAGYRYVGARYVPIFAEPIEWVNTRTYEPLTIVLHEGNSYTSKQHVPVGIDIENEDYWAITGNYNAQVEEYRRQVQEVIDKLDNIIVNYGKYYDDVSAMKADEDIQMGMIVSTAGYHEKGDGGSATYIIVNSGTANDRTVIACQNNLFAQLVTTGKLNPQQLGAYGDGTTDDSDTVQFILDNNISVEYDKQYKLNKTVNVPAYAGIQTSIDSEYDYTFIVDMNVGNIFKITGPGVIFNNVYIKGTNIQTGIYFDRVGDQEPTEELTNSDLEFLGCKFSSLETCFSGTGRNIKFKECLFSNSYVGVEIRLFSTDNPNLHMRGIIIDSCRFHSMNKEGFTGVCVKCPDTYNIYFHSNMFINNLIDFCDIGLVGNISGFKISNNEFMYMQGAIIDCNAPTAIESYRNTHYMFSDNVCSAQTNISDTLLKINGLSFYKICNNTFTSVKKVFDISKCDEMSFTGNLIDYNPSEEETDRVGTFSNMNAMFIAGNQFSVSTGKHVEFDSVSTIYSGGNETIGTDDTPTYTSSTKTEMYVTRFW